MVAEILILLVVFQVKHFLADYPLQNRYMLGKFLPGWAFFFPLLSHVMVHGLFTFFIVLAWTGDDMLAMMLASLDGLVHFLMDRLKAGPRYLGRWKHDSPFFWWALGLDQMVHHLTHYLIIWITVTR